MWAECGRAVGGAWAACPSTAAHGPSTRWPKATVHTRPQAAGEGEGVRGRGQRPAKESPGRSRGSGIAAHTCVGCGCHARLCLAPSGAAVAAQGRSCALSHPSPLSRVMGSAAAFFCGVLPWVAPARISSARYPCRVVASPAQLQHRPRCCFRRWRPSPRLFDPAPPESLVPITSPISARQGGDAVPSSDEGFRTRFPGSHPDRLPQPSCASYLPSLPRLRLPGATRIQGRQRFPT